jgi:hypothetical protein
VSCRRPAKHKTAVSTNAGKALLQNWDAPCGWVVTQCFDQSVRQTLASFTTNLHFVGRMKWLVNRTCAGGDQP